MQTSQLALLIESCVLLPLLFEHLHSAPIGVIRAIIGREESGHSIQHSQAKLGSHIT